MTATRSRTTVVAQKAWLPMGMAKPDGLAVEMLGAVIQSLLLFMWSHLLRCVVRRSCQDRGALLVK
ncbi:hypothetical protein ASC77_20120 [Nocardioides sp. Root1257]|nr:hypothetical protein ASC77_20120 [Nocardioides sp. Root1257]KRC45908.1 hypothetical protein ASE24_15100 [Nocardioides sp. Root224]